MAILLLGLIGTLAAIKLIDITAQGVSRSLDMNMNMGTRRTRRRRR